MGSFEHRLLCVSNLLSILLSFVRLLSIVFIALKAIQAVLLRVHWLNGFDSGSVGKFPKAHTSIYPTSKNQMLIPSTSV